MRRHFWSCSLHQNVHDAVELDSVILPTIKQTKLDLFNFTFNWKEMIITKLELELKDFFIKIKGCLFNWPSPVFNAKRKTNRQPNMLVHEISSHNYAFGKMQVLFIFGAEKCKKCKDGEWSREFVLLFF